MNITSSFRTTLMIAVVIILLTRLAGNAQIDTTRSVVDSNDTVEVVPFVRNGIGLMPARAKVINGWAIGWLVGLDMTMKNTPESEKINGEINGIHTNLSPVPAIALGYFGAYVVASAIPLSVQGLIKVIKKATDKNKNHSNDNNTTTDSSDSSYVVHPRTAEELAQPNSDNGAVTTVNGVSISTFEWSEESAVRGLQLGGVFNNVNRIEGVSIAPLLVQAEYSNGVMLSAVNVSHFKGRGLQIGLVNYARSYHGVQVGLWNRNSKRSLPFVNFCF